MCELRNERDTHKIYIYTSFRKNLSNYYYFDKIIQVFTIHVRIVFKNC
jgi:hypothetical protein